MWIVVLMSAALAEEPAAMAPSIDCSVHEDAACEGAKARLAEIVAELEEKDCTKGGKKKRAACIAETAELELEQTELTTRWAPPAEEEEAAEEGAMTRGLPFAIPSADDEGEEGKPSTNMEIDVSDE